MLHKTLILPKSYSSIIFILYVFFHNVHFCSQWISNRYNAAVVAELKVVLKLITLGVKFQECAAHSNKSNNSKLTLERNLLIVITAKR